MCLIASVVMDFKMLVPAGMKDSYHNILIYVNRKNQYIDLVGCLRFRSNPDIVGIAQFGSCAGGGQVNGFKRQGL
jgi:hypothetical protein